MNIGEKACFFEKKKQKTFDHSGARQDRALSQILQKFFGSFFQKRTSFLSSVMLEDE